MSDIVQVRKKAQVTLPQSVRQELGIEDTPTAKPAGTVCACLFLLHIELSIILPGRTLAAFRKCIEDFGLSVTAT